MTGAGQGIGPDMMMAIWDGTGDPVDMGEWV
jgi:hypothetical protein